MADGRTTRARSIINLQMGPVTWERIIVKGRGWIGGSEGILNGFKAGEPLPQNGGEEVVFVEGGLLRGVWGRLQVGGGENGTPLPATSCSKKI